MHVVSGFSSNIDTGVCSVYKDTKGDRCQIESVAGKRIKAPDIQARLDDLGLDPIGNYA